MEIGVQNNVDRSILTLQDYQEIVWQMKNGVEKNWNLWLNSMSSMEHRGLILVLCCKIGKNYLSQVLMQYKKQI